MIGRRFTPLMFNIGIRSRLSLVVILAIVPLFALLLSGAIADRRLAIEAANESASYRAKLGAAWQEKGFQDARDVLSVLRQLSGATLADPSRCHAILQDVAGRYPQFTSIGFVNQDNIVNCMSLSNAPMAFGDAEVFKATMVADPAAVVLGKFMIGPLTGKPIVVVAEPLPSTGGNELRPGIAFVSLDLEWATHRMVDGAGGDATTTSLIDRRESKILARSPEQRRFAGRVLPISPLTQAMRNGPEGGSVEATDLDGTRMIFGFAPLDNAPGLMVAVGVPREAVLAAANRRLSVGMGCAILVTVVAAAMAWLFAHATQVKAIRSLLVAARKLGAGDLAAPTPMEPWQAPEFRALSDTLSRMAVSIATAQADLKDSERQLRLLADHSTDMIIRVREGGCRLFVSPASYKLTGWNHDEMVRMSSQDTIHPDDVGFVSDPRVFGETPFVFTYRMRHKDGRYIWVEGAARGLPTDAGEPRECIIVVRDVAQRVEAERRLRDSEARYRMLEEQGTDMIFQLDRDMVRQYVSPACREILGYTSQELTGTKPVGMVHPEDAKRVSEVFRSVLDGEVDRTAVVNRIRHRDGHWVWVEAQLRASPSAQVGIGPGIIGSLRDVSVRKAAEEQLEAANRRLADLARIDGLTGLANRRAFDETLARVHHQAVSRGSLLALVMIDVDSFKSFNDCYGHVAGDECLRRVSRAIESVLYHPGDVAARYGGEEFAVVLPDTDEAGAAKVAERIRLAVLGMNIDHEVSSIGRVSISVGVAFLLPEALDAGVETLISQADHALYAAKHKGRNQVVRASALKFGVADINSVAAGPWRF